MNLLDEVNKVGYVSRSVPFKGTDLKEEILKLKKEKNAVILAHYYVDAEIQDLADFLGDSLALAQAAEKTDADMIVFCGVHFMGETAKILNPNKKVVIPDFNAGCSLADSAPKEEFAAFKAQYPEAVVVSYINCTADVKAMTDIICTSSNALKVVESIPADKQIIFAPDANLGRYVAKKTGRDLILWDGACIVHIDISLEKLKKVKEENPNALLIAHPECKEVILSQADFVGSTTALLNFVKDSDCQEFIVATEAGILHKMKESVPNKKIIPAPANEKNTCACSECPYMKMNTLEKLYNAMFYELPEIQVAEDVREPALKALKAMLDISK
ncbi:MULTISPECIES: quinolinate synthase NadA [Bacteroidota]|jgi:quinolinate synthase|uniref:Quinolinate synthase n=1 Tax=Flectobacillus roseus TaxID=502259 RepID=A0ABT6YDD6_9BACT|nr:MULTISPECIES: quinolinate synthase NadA [Bacteroidota]MDI9861555.1 quinolinate synthase NadA [Flectobacillus roseus]NBA77669.1 quinolinate synthase NadA [Emticicia sp. ODNR4P]NBB30740.1 quinolinate synthase NadA [Cellulophaga sp. BC115SP]PAC32189.1 quinolinate synthase [Flectobacillus sp. BAB-3569]